MCRSAIEFPPNGKRCAFGDHLSAADKAEWRVKRAARERELYYIRKARKAGDAEQNTIESDVAADRTISFENPKPQVIDVAKLLDAQPEVDPYQDAHDSLIILSKNKELLGGGYDDYDVRTWISTKQSRNATEYLLNTRQSDSAYMKIVGKDSNFDVNSVNSVSRVYLEDGRTAYFKNYVLSADDHYVHADYQHDVLESFNNEVAAYRLTQIMGEGYSHFVPETVFREYDGKIGTLQIEAEGEVGAHNNYEDFSADFDYDLLRRAAIFEYLAGSQDRHAGNYAVKDNGHDGKDELVFIDNGFSFPCVDNAMYGSVNISKMSFGVEEHILLQEDEIEMINRVSSAVNDEGGELFSILSDQQKEFMNKRIQFALDDWGISRDTYLYNMDY